MFDFRLFVIGVQQIEEIFPLARTTFRSSFNMVDLGENFIKWRKIREKKIRGFFYLLCSIIVEIILYLFVFLPKYGYKSVVN